MSTPKVLQEFLISLTPEEAEELWDYFDGCTNEGIIEIVTHRALQSLAIREKHKLIPAKKGKRKCPKRKS